MTEDIKPSELGAFTNNLSNKEGIKKLVEAVNGIEPAVHYTAGDNIAISEQNVISATDTKYTAGTGITISEQNVISALGGDWTVHTDKNWSDLFDITNNNKPLKDVLIIPKNADNDYVNVAQTIFFFKKDTVMYNAKWMIDIRDRENTYDNKTYLVKVFVSFYGNGWITDTTLPIYYKQFKYNLDANNQIVLTTADNMGSLDKSYFTVLYKD